MEIWIPSRGRASILAETIQQIPKHWYPKVRIAVSTNDPQVGLYRSKLDRYFPVFVFDAERINEKRVKMAQQCEDLTMFMMDDDIKFFKRKSDDDFHLVAMSSDEVGVMFSHVSEKLSRYSAVGISAREGNNRLPVPLVENTRLMRAVGYRTDDFLACEHGRVDVMEDFDVLLQLLRAGKPNANLTQFAQDQRMTNAPGGCSVWRTHALHEASARRLQELHPAFVQLRQKTNKTGGEFGTRTEVTISWKKAYEEGLRNVQKCA